MSNDHKIETKNRCKAIFFRTLKFFFYTNLKAGFNINENRLFLHTGLVSVAGDKANHKMPWESSIKVLNKVFLTDLCMCVATIIGSVLKSRGGTGHHQ